MWLINYRDSAKKLLVCDSVFSCCSPIKAISGLLIRSKQKLIWQIVQPPKPKELEKFFEKKFDADKNRREDKVSTRARTKKHEDGTTSRSTTNNWTDSNHNSITLEESESQSELQVEDGKMRSAGRDKDPKLRASLKWKKEGGEMQPVSGTPLTKKHMEILAKKYGIDPKELVIDEETGIVTVKELKGKQLQSLPGFEKNDGLKSWGSFLQAARFVKAPSFVNLV